MPHPDGPKATAAGSWLAYPALAARLGPAGEGGVALFRTVPAGRDGADASLEIASAIPAAGGKAWGVSRAACDAPALLAAANLADAKPDVEGGRMAHLRLAPVLRIAGDGPRDAFVLAARARRAEDGAVASDAIVLAAIRPAGPEGWTVDGRPCEAKRFE